MIYTIISIVPQIDKSTGQQKKDPHGNNKYTLHVKDPNGQIIQFNKGYRDTPNKVGDTLDGSLEPQSGEYGTWYKFVANKGNMGGNRGYTESPEKQESIERQNSLSNALALSIAVAQVFMAEKKYEEAHKALSGKEVLVKATTFYDYNHGSLKVPVKTEDQLISEAKRSATEVIADDYHERDEHDFDDAINYMEGE